MDELELAQRIDALREDAMAIARELSRRAALPGMSYDDMRAAAQMQSAANGLAGVQRSVSTLTPGGASEAA